MAMLVLRYKSEHDYRFVFEVASAFKDRGLITEAATDFVDYGSLT